MTGILAFGVLAHEKPVDVVVLAIAETRASAGEGADGPDVGVELQWTSDGEEEAPEGDVVGYV